MLKLSFLTVSLNVGLNVLLIPADIRALGVELAGLGALGAAIATVISTAFRYAGLRYYAGKLVPLDPQWPHLLRQLLAVAAMGVTIWWVGETIADVLRWYHLVVLGLTGLGLYTALMWLIGEFTDEDLEFFLDVLSPAGLADYVQEELPEEDEEEGDGSEP